MKIIVSGGTVFPTIMKNSIGYLLSLVLCSLSVRADVLVTAGNNNTIFRYDQTTGAFLGTFDGTIAINPYGLAYGPDGLLYTATQSEIERFDPRTGKRIGAFGSFSGTRGMTIGPDGLLYVGVFATNGQILRYNPTTGVLIDTYISNINTPTGMVFGPDGNLYVCSDATDSVLKFNGSTGALMATLITEPGLQPLAIVFGPDGNIYLGGDEGSYPNQVRRYSASTGAFDRVFATSPNLDAVAALSFGPDGNLYVASSRKASILRFDATTGAFLDTFIPSGSGGLLGNDDSILFTQDNAVIDFSVTQNPAGAWSYGYTTGLGGPFSTHTTAQANFVPGLDRWGSPAVDPSFTLAVTRNNTSSPIPNQTVPPTLSFPPDMLTLHPIPGLYDVVRWTAPFAGTFNVNGMFAGLDTVTSVADTDVHILRNSTTEIVPPTVLRGLGTQEPFSITLTVNSGETLDFAVGNGPSGVLQNDSTGLKVTINPVSALGVTVGTISVATNLLSASFSITGPATYVGSGTSFIIPNAPVGTYKITYGDVQGYQKPQDDTKVLVPGTILKFVGTYVPLPSLSLFPLSLSTTYVEGSPAPILPLPLLVTSTSTNVDFTVQASTTPTGGTWLTVVPTNSSTPTLLFVQVAPGLARGTYFGQVKISATSAVNSPAVVPITLTVTPPSVVASPKSLTFQYTLGDKLPDGQTLSVSSDGTQLLFTAAATTNLGGDWLSIGSTAGATPSLIPVSAAPVAPRRDISPGSYSGTITVTSSGAADSPLKVPVTLVVSAPALMALTPRLPNKIVGQMQTFDATLLDTTLKPIPNRQVVFSVTGVNQTVAKSTTDSSGTASFSYIGTAPGTDSVVATAAVNGFQIASEMATVTWNAIPIGQLLPIDTSRLPADLSQQQALYGEILDPVFRLANDQRADSGLFNGDRCYTGGMDAIAFTLRPNLDTMRLQALATGIIDLIPSLLSTGSILGDFLVAATVKMVTTDQPPDRSTLEFATEQSIGYVLSKATTKYLAGYAEQPLSDAIVKSLLQDDGDLNDSFKASNQGSPYLNGDDPVTAVQASVAYNPWSKFIAGGIRATCQLASGPETHYYVFRFPVNGGAVPTGAADVCSATDHKCTSVPFISH